ncbi:hypothetical protein GYMLUDRAFT_265678 [Collybiopsis luxurians FD-317 M1]|uniref:Unplaced genomic scaffold GYMLUscaffold_107, whole genome shotgun sequence n=1 Tax=Collybiopsis luxurians FD-317 M1 TaxID=944289 RepID=A0A0D0CAB2_9AGAR|nr:hypothetical protein GYMLUDRAFT_265678 [Collybiopsis luxurians FD-317 M1]
MRQEDYSFFASTVYTDLGKSAVEVYIGDINRKSNWIIISAKRVIELAREKSYTGYPDLPGPQKASKPKLNGWCLVLVVGSIPSFYLYALFPSPFNHDDLLYSIIVDPELGNPTVAQIVDAAAAEHLTPLNFKLGGKSPVIADPKCSLELAVKRTIWGKLTNCGQLYLCIARLRPQSVRTRVGSIPLHAGSRIFVQSRIYDEFLAKFTEKSRALTVGDLFATNSYQGPQMSQIQYHVRDFFVSLNRQEQGATVHLGGEHHGTEGFFIQPATFTDTIPDMRIVQEEIFGPVGVIIKFEDEEAVFSEDINRALTIAHRLRAGTAWVNCVNQLHANTPFVGFKQSGIGRELGEYALKNYTAIKAVHINLGHTMN